MWVLGELGELWERVHQVMSSLLSQYKEESELRVGESVLGRVKLAKHKHTGQYAAVKIIPKPRRTQQEKTAKVSPSRSVDKEVKRES